ncbi:MAG: hypothetical protein IJX80_04115 [Clostridia bacterium]|nr:hypothetical protein [Clostridia bacterium]
MQTPVVVFDGAEDMKLLTCIAACASNMMILKDDGHSDITVFIKCIEHVESDGNGEKKI